MAQLGQCARAMERYSIVDPPPAVRRLADPLTVEPAVAGQWIENPSTTDLSTEDESSPHSGGEPDVEAEELELEVSYGGVDRPMNASGSSASVSAGIAAANALAAGGIPPGAGWRVPRLSGEDRGHSLAEMAQRDLDAALQLLADRAQYITGAGGAAIALRHDQRNDMVCRASVGEKAPELGALLSTESGLSGESVRTRMPLRCDDAERDPRVNRESCRGLGIASVMIVPITGDDPRGEDQVLGVFELFSGEIRAFADRDLSALQRLGEMVETAVKLARAAEIDSLEMAARDLAPEQIELEYIPSEQTQKGKVRESAMVLDDEPVLEVELDEVAAELPRAAVVAEAAPAVDPAADVLPPPTGSGSPAPIFSAPSVSAPVVTAPIVTSSVVTSALGPGAVPPEIGTEAVKKIAVEEPVAKLPLMWSAAVHASPEAAKASETDQSHVPPMLRNLRKCKACGFPVSEGRTLCVECDEKQWRGQPLPAAAKAKVGAPAVDFRQASNAITDSAEDSPRLNRTSSRVPPKSDFVVPASTSFSGAASSSSSPVRAPSAPANLSSTNSLSANPGAARVAPQSLAAALAELKEQEKRVESSQQGGVVVPAKALGPAPEACIVISAGEKSGSATTVSATTMTSTKPAERAHANASAEPVRLVENPAFIHPATLNFTGGLGTSESWFAANKYVLGAILVIAAVVAAVVWLH